MERFVSNAHASIRPETMSSCWCGLIQSQGGTLIRGRVVDVIFQQDQFKVTLEGGLFVYVDVAPKIGQETHS